jgi:hypothetical protein
MTKSAKPAAALPNLPASLEGLVVEINTVFEAEDALVKERNSKISAATKSIEDEAKPAIDDKRLEAGRLLLAAKAQVPNGEFARWMEVNFGHGRPPGRTYRSRSDCYQCMRMAGADDPEKEREKEKADTRSRVQKHRDGKKAAAASIPTVSVTSGAVTDAEWLELPANELPTTAPEDQLPWSFCSAPPAGSSAEDIAYALIGDRGYTRMKTLEEYLNHADRNLDAVDAGQWTPTAHAESSYYRAPVPVRQRVRELLSDRDWARDAEATLAANVVRKTEIRDQAHAAAKATLTEAKASAEPEIAALKALAEELSPAAKLALADWVSDWDTDALTDAVLARPLRPAHIDIRVMRTINQLEGWIENFAATVAPSINDEDLDPDIRAALVKAFSVAHGVMTLGPARMAA